MEVVRRMQLEVQVEGHRWVDETLCSKGTEKWEHIPGREEGRSNSEDEEEQDKASQQLALSASSWCNEGTSASSFEHDLPRVRGALGECGGAGKSGAAKDERKRPLSNSPSRLPTEEDASLGDLCREKG